MNPSLKVFAIACFLLVPVRARADIQPAPLFADHMVLQRDMPIAIWGEAAPGEMVAAMLAGKLAETTADANGHWLLKLEALPAGGPHELSLRGNNRIDIKDVLVGEVWVASGQSNMEMKLATCEGGADAASAAKDSQIRVFRVGGSLQSKPSTELKGHWQLCTPENAKDWSAAGYFFARDLRKSLGVPVALLQNAVGWTPAEAWTSREALVSDPDLKRGIVDRYEAWQAQLPKAKELYALRMAEWKTAAEQAKQSGKPVPAEPAAPQDVTQFQHCASVLFNGMLRPLMPYGIRGVIWYQGETNASRADQYRNLFPLMIRDWRKHWGQGDFPFIFVQIAPLDAGSVDRAELRDAQREALAERNTAMVVTVDIGMAKDEHPQKKREVGERLARAAEKLAYGKDVIGWGPLYKQLKIEGPAIRVEFDSVGSGLVVAGGVLKGFSIAGVDQKFVPAEARIDGSTLVVSAASVATPIAVRYAWANLPEYSLFNKEGLPASPFRTDDWPLTTVGETRVFYDQIGVDPVTLVPRQ